MKRFFVVLDRITISSPTLHCGHLTNPFFGEFVPKRKYFFSFEDHDRNPLLSKY